VVEDFPMGGGPLLWPPFLGITISQIIPLGPSYTHCHGSAGTRWRPSGVNRDYITFADHCYQYQSSSCLYWEIHPSSLVLLDIEPHSETSVFEVHRHLLSIPLLSAKSLIGLLLCTRKQPTGYTNHAICHPGNRNHGTCDGIWSSNSMISVRGFYKCLQFLLSYFCHFQSLKPHLLQLLQRLSSFKETIQF
jgi:GAF domain-containing protein